MLFKKPAVSWLVVFLGNPGLRHEKTRHNAGFMASAFLEKAEGIKINRLKFSALICLCELGGAKALLMKPQTFMNLSGKAVKQAADFYKIPPERVIAVSDDVSLPAGKLRIRRGGSDGGQRGLRSIIESLGTDAFPRVKIGVGAPPGPEHDMVSWVLSVPSGEDEKAITNAAERAARAVLAYITSGPDKAMSEYN